MFTVIIIGVVILIALSIICITAYMIGAESFEFTTAIGKIASLSVKMRSPGKRGRSVRKALNVPQISDRSRPKRSAQQRSDPQLRRTPQP